MFDYIRTLALRLQAGEISGFTVSAATGDARTSGFAVGGDPECPEVRLANFADMPSRLLTMHLNNYVDAVFQYGQGTVGGWVHEGYLYLDAPTIFPDQEDARSVSHERGELAYFDLNTMTEHTITD